MESLSWKCPRCKTFLVMDDSIRDHINAAQEATCPPTSLRNLENPTGGRPVRWCDSVERRTDITKEAMISAPETPPKERAQEMLH